jgi:hypothetical protein
LNVQRIGAREPLDRKGDGDAPAAYRDYEPRPWRLQRIIAAGCGEESLGRDQDLQGSRDKSHGPVRTHPLQDEGETHGFRHRDPLGLHADRAVRDNPSLFSPGLAALGDESRRAFTCARPCGIGGAKTSGMENGQFLFDSCSGKT